MSNRINAHIAQLLLQPSVPVILYIIVCSSWHLCSNQRPSAQQKTKSKISQHHPFSSITLPKEELLQVHKPKRKKKTQNLCTQSQYVCLRRMAICQNCHSPLQQKLQNIP